MELQENTDIISSADASMIDQICRDKRVDNSWLFFFFLTVRYDIQKKSLRFMSMKEMWKYGLVVKRYIEYPNNQVVGESGVFEEIGGYIQRNDYVLHYTDENLENDDVNMILRISLPERKVDFRSWHPDGSVTEESLTYKEYCERHTSYISSLSKMRFDIYQPTYNAKEMVVRVDNMLTRVNDGKISKLDRIRCLNNSRSLNVSLKVLQEWFFVFEQTIDWLCKEGVLNGNTVYSEDERQLFKTDVGCDIPKYLNQMIRVYNKLMDRLKKELWGDGK